MPFAQLLLICGFLHGFQAQFVLELSSFQYMPELEMGEKDCGMVKSSAPFLRKLALLLQQVNARTFEDLLIKHLKGALLKWIPIL